MRLTLGVLLVLPGFITVVSAIRQVAAIGLSQQDILWAQ